MKKMVTAGIVALMAAVFAASPAVAFEGSADAYIGVYNDYVFRGINFTSINADGEESDFVVQGGMNVSFGNFTVSTWFNASEDLDVDEIDFVLDYSFDVNDMVSMSVGNVFYNVDGVDDTNEIYLGVSLATILEPSLTVYYDYDELAGFMVVDAAVGHSYELSDAASVSVGALLRYADDGDDYSCLHNYELSAGVDFALTEGITLSGSALFSDAASDDAEDAGLEDEAVIGISVSAAF